MGLRGGGPELPREDLGGGTRSECREMVRVSGENVALQIADQTPSRALGQAVQGSANEWFLGCVILASLSPLAAGVRFTQPRYQFSSRSLSISDATSDRDFKERIENQTCKKSREKLRYREAASHRGRHPLCPRSLVRRGWSADCNL